jgi:hypothetical protein
LRALEVLTLSFRATIATETAADAVILAVNLDACFLMVVLLFILKEGVPVAIDMGPDELFVKKIWFEVTVIVIFEFELVVAVFKELFGPASHAKLFIKKVR